MNMISLRTGKTTLIFCRRSGLKYDLRAALAANRVAVYDVDALLNQGATLAGSTTLHLLHRLLNDTGDARATVVMVTALPIAEESADYAIYSSMDAPAEELYAEDRDDGPSLIHLRTNEFVAARVTRDGQPLALTTIA